PHRHDFSLLSGSRPLKIPPLQREKKRRDPSNGSRLSSPVEGLGADQASSSSALCVVVSSDAASTSPASSTCWPVPSATCAVGASVTEADSGAAACASICSSVGRTSVSVTSSVPSGAGTPSKSRNGLTVSTMPRLNAYVSLSQYAS